MAEPAKTLQRRGAKRRLTPPPIDLRTCTGAEFLAHVPRSRVLRTTRALQIVSDLISDAPDETRSRLEAILGEIIDLETLEDVRSRCGRVLSA